MTDARRMTEPGNPPRKAADEPEHWLVRAATVRNLWIVFTVLLVVVALGDFAVKHYRHFGVGGTFGFYVWFGFAACAALFALSRVAGVLVLREDDYYERHPESFEDVDQARHARGKGGRR